MAPERQKESASAGGGGAKGRPMVADNGGATAVTEGCAASRPAYIPASDKLEALAGEAGVPERPGTPDAAVAVMRAAGVCETSFFPLLANKQEARSAHGGQQAAFVTGERAPANLSAVNAERGTESAVASAEICGCRGVKKSPLTVPAAEPGSPSPSQEQHTVVALKRPPAPVPAIVATSGPQTEAAGGHVMQSGMARLPKPEAAPTMQQAASRAADQGPLLVVSAPKQAAPTHGVVAGRVLSRLHGRGASSTNIGQSAGILNGFKGQESATAAGSDRKIGRPALGGLHNIPDESQRAPSATGLRAGAAEGSTPVANGVDSKSSCSHMGAGAKGDNCLMKPAVGSLAAMAAARGIGQLPPLSMPKAADKLGPRPLPHLPGLIRSLKDASSVWQPQSLSSRLAEEERDQSVGRQASGAGASSSGRPAEEKGRGSDGHHELGPVRDTTGTRGTSASQWKSSNGGAVPAAVPNGLSHQGQATGNSPSCSQLLEDTDIEVLVAKQTAAAAPRGARIANEEIFARHEEAALDNLVDILLSGHLGGLGSTKEAQPAAARQPPFLIEQLLLLPLHEFMAHHVLPAHQPMELQDLLARGVAWLAATAEVESKLLWCHRVAGQGNDSLDLLQEGQPVGGSGVRNLWRGFKSETGNSTKLALLTPLKDSAGWGRKAKDGEGDSVGGGKDLRRLADSYLKSDRKEVAVPAAGKLQLGGAGDMTVTCQPGEDEEKRADGLQRRPGAPTSASTEHSGGGNTGRDKSGKERSMKERRERAKLRAQRAKMQGEGSQQSLHHSQVQQAGEPFLGAPDVALQLRQDSWRSPQFAPPIAPPTTTARHEEDPPTRVSPSPSRRLGVSPKRTCRDDEVTPPLTDANAEAAGISILPAGEAAELASDPTSRKSTVDALDVNEGARKSCLGGMRGLLAAELASRPGDMLDIHQDQAKGALNASQGKEDPAFVANSSGGGIAKVMPSPDGQGARQVGFKRRRQRGAAAGQVAEELMAKNATSRKKADPKIGCKVVDQPMKVGEKDKDQAVKREPSPESESEDAAAALLLFSLGIDLPVGTKNANLPGGPPGRQRPERGRKVRRKGGPKPARKGPGRKSPAVVPTRPGSKPKLAVWSGNAWAGQSKLEKKGAAASTSAPEVKASEPSKKDITAEGGHDGKIERTNKQAGQDGMITGKSVGMPRPRLHRKRRLGADK